MVQLSKKTCDLMLCFFLGFMILNCQSEPTAEHNFKEFIGTHNYKVTTEFLNQFESDLFKYYKTADLQRAYKSYLEDWASGRPPQIYDCSSCENFEAYYMSGMESSRIEYFYDTTWSDQAFKYYLTAKDTLKHKRCEIGLALEEEIEVIGPNRPSTYIYSKWGLFLPALTLIADADTVITAFVDHMYTVGYVSPRAFSSGVLSHEIDMSTSFFRKLIILNEFHYAQMKAYGCVLHSSRCSY